MNWITENYGNIFTVLFAACALARTIVYLTPTPKDDMAVEKVSVWINGIAKIFGLDITQGNNKSK